MNLMFDAIERLSRHAFSWSEYTALAMLVLTGLLLLFTYAIARQDWAEIGAWASLASVAVAVHFMVVGWREVAGADRLQMMAVNSLKPDGAGSAIKDCPDCPELVVIPPGYFIMGADGPTAAPEEGPQRKIMIVRRFAIGRQAVTAAEFRAFVAATGYAGNVCGGGAVECVSWQDAQAYVDWLTRQTGRVFRLATAAEWEYVGRAGSQPPRTAPPGGLIRTSTTVAPADPGNGFGVLGLASGLSELVEDCWSPTLAEVPSDGRALSAPLARSCSFRVAKRAVADADFGELRYSGRRPIAANPPTPGVAFRVARDLPTLPK